MLYYIETMKLTLDHADKYIATYLPPSYITTCIETFCTQTSRDEPILPAKFLEKWDYESKEQNSRKIGGVSRQNQMLYLNK